jgi:hypothetical protein
MLGKRAVRIQQGRKASAYQRNLMTFSSPSYCEECQSWAICRDVHYPLVRAYISIGVAEVIRVGTVEISTERLARQAERWKSAEWIAMRLQ